MSATSSTASAAIEQITGRKVVAFMSANHIDPDLAVELFMLEPSEQSAGDGSSPGGET